MSYCEDIREIIGNALLIIVRPSVAIINKGSFLKLCCFWRVKKRIDLVIMLKLAIIFEKELQTNYECTK